MTEDRVWLITISAALSYILAATILHCQLDVSDVLRQFDVVERKTEFRCNVFYILLSYRTQNWIWFLSRKKIIDFHYFKKYIEGDTNSFYNIWLITKNC